MATSETQFPFDTDDVGLIMLALMLMTYANLVLYNTGGFAVSVMNEVTTFAYDPPALAMAGALVLYLVAFLALLSVGSAWSASVSKLSYVTPFVYGVVGILFLKNVFSTSVIRERVMGGKTDGYVLQYEGAGRLLRGKNPYTYNYDQEILAQVPGYFRTPLTPDLLPQGVQYPTNIVTHLDYPPVSVIWYLPARALGVSGATQDLVAMMLLVALVTVVARDELRTFIPIFFLIDWNLILFPSAFIPDAAWVLFVVCAILSLHYPRLSALFLALGASYRPQPIIVAPYLGIIAYNLYGKQYLKKWVVTGLSATALINVPFALWTGLGAYWEYVTIPISITLPPSGVGPAMLVDYLQLDPMAVKPLFTVAVFGAWFLTLAASYRYYDKLGVGMLAFPGLVLWFHWRSLQNYMLWFPMFVFVAYIVGVPERDPLESLKASSLRLRRDVSDGIEGAYDEVYSRVQSIRN
ncbi:hypothetical protein [Halopelagius longus]|uniref:DUF2029 domain-containing protein n=1 Tax=Halopelagius longus TaxID=1236180 RepID=A0A1H1FJ76_9EURY|nr:hypothetical protein [Halopelagius longus]RDI70071.1 hypothetical protein DWB78_15700 [Halopelagius longus]SDR01092.1 hypothetical protein SAMN05216278_3247 [Halopelagius longus]